MRTTLTLDPDISSRLKAEAHRTGRPFKVVVNDALRRGLSHAEATRAAQPFAVKPHDFGGTRPGITVDKIGALISQLEGPDYT